MGVYSLPKTVTRERRDCTTHLYTSMGYVYLLERVDKERTDDGPVTSSRVPATAEPAGLLTLHEYQPSLSLLAPPTDHVTSPESLPHITTQTQLTHVNFCAHVKTASRIVHEQYTPVHHLYIEPVVYYTHL